MTNNKKKKVGITQDNLKYEIAEELGLLDKINEVGWAGLTAKESGRIGGIITSKKRDKQKQIDKK